MYDFIHIKIGWFRNTHLPLLLPFPPPLILNIMGHPYKSPLTCFSLSHEASAARRSKVILRRIRCYKIERYEPSISVIVIHALKEKIRFHLVVVILFKTHVLNAKQNNQKAQTQLNSHDSEG